MTVARFSVEHEKNNVASLKTCATACEWECQIKNSQQTFNEVHSWQAMPHSSLLSFVLAQTGSFAAGHIIYGSPILQCEVQHVKH
jgi:hypothetical protein